MKNQFNLNIKTPCQENFNQFASTPNGGFCDACEKEVIDFTKMNTEEINTYFSLKGTQNTCGRFKSNQLDTFGQAPQQNNFKNIAAGIGIACLSLFSITTAFAQGELNTKTSISQQQDTFVVKGNVSDNLEPIPGVNVVLEGSEIGTTTDFDGNFKFPQELKKGDVLIFSYVGMESKKIIIENQESVSDIALNINMELETVHIMGKVAVKGVYKSNKSK